MGVDCKIYLPPNVTLTNVARVMGAVLGFEPRWTDVGDGCRGVSYTEVEATPTDVCPSMARITVRGRTVDGEAHHHVYYFFEAAGTEGWRMLMPRSTAFWIAVGLRLIDFFGGQIDFQDNDDITVDRSVVAKVWQENAPQDGEDWQDLQDRIAALKPVTVDEWRMCEEFAAYQTPLPKEKA